jgi:hypothetical protein
MSKSIRDKCFAFLAILLIGAWPGISRAQNLNDQDTILTRARDFLQAFYPELFGKDLLLNLYTSQSIDHSWRQIYGIRFDVKPYDPQSERMRNPPFDARSGKRLPAPDNSALLEGLIWFNQGGWLHEMGVGGPIVHAEQNETIHKLVESHPEWSEVQACEALKEAGAHYGPGDKKELIKRIQLEKLERFLGHCTVKSVEFHGLGESHEGNFADLYWSVELEVDSPNGGHSSYSLIFEPFDGKLTQIIHGMT